MTITYTSTHTVYPEYYNTYPQIIESTEEIVDNLQTITGAGGRFENQSYVDTEYLYHKFKLVHYGLSDTQANNIISHYSIFKDMAFSVYIKSVSAYVICMYLGPPLITYIGTGVKTIEVDLVEMPQLDHKI